MAACSLIEGNASARCGISMKGVDIVVKGSIGHMCAFMAQAGNLVVLGDAGEALGDSIYEARLFVRGTGEKPRRRLRREADARRASSEFLRALLDTGRHRRRNRCRRIHAATARRARSIISMSTMPALIEVTMTRLSAYSTHRAALFGDLRSTIRCRKFAAPRRPASTTSAAAARSASCRISTICCFSARRCRAIRSKAIARDAAPMSCSARASPRSRSNSKFRSPSPA